MPLRLPVRLTWGTGNRSQIIATQNLLLQRQKNQRMEKEEAKQSVKGTFVPVVIIGGGQAGLAMSACLSQKSIRHVILERGRLVERWRSERWDGLRLLTPNWMTRLPGGYQYAGTDPDGFMTMSETVQFFVEYAEKIQAPVQTSCEVTTIDVENGIQASSAIYRVFYQHDGQSSFYRTHNIVLATGFCDVPRTPAWASELQNHVRQITPSGYHRPSQLLNSKSVIGPNILIVGASATGCQIAEQLLDFVDSNDAISSNRPQIFLAVGRHTRLPRRYRDKDILHWLYSIGFFDEACDAATERLAPAPQLIGSPPGQFKDLDLHHLQSRGVKLLGRVTGMETNGHAHAVLRLGDDLRENLSTADDKLQALLRKIDAHIDELGLIAEPAPTTFASVAIPENLPRHLDLLKNGIGTIVWCTGYERRYPFLQENFGHILSKESGDLRHTNGCTAESGIFCLGMRFQCFRNSNFIDGVGRDAEAIAEAILHRTGSYAHELLVE